MKTQQTNLVIVSENALVVNGLRHFLENKFGSSIRITTFFDTRNMLKKIDASTDAVIVDYFVEGKKGSDVVRSAQMLNPGIQGIFHSCSEDVAAAVSGIVKGELSSKPARKKYAYKFDDQFSHYYARL